ncbi:MAG: hypothetical protein SCALA702_32470 [Melioribacteraceae bacterium]|nr:MAG: hypothetical protein SCALA702_32470 [Melioribacteraceae bacterium]
MDEPEEMKILVLIVDDNEDDYEFISDIFLDFNIYSFYADSTEKMLEKLSGLHHKLSAIILDIKGKKKTDQELPNIDFIRNATGFLERNPKYIKIPSYIASGSPNERAKTREIFSDKHVFTKDPEEISELARKIVEDAKNQDRVLIRNEYKHIFDIIRTTDLDDGKDKIIQDIILNIDTTEKDKIKSYLNEIRKIGESIYKRSAKVLEFHCEKTFSAIHKINSGNRYRNGNPRVQTDYFYKDRAVEHAFFNIHWIGSYHGAHDPDTLGEDDIDPVNFPTNYTLKTLVYSLFDILLWYERIYQKGNTDA